MSFYINVDHRSVQHIHQKRDARSEQEKNINWDFQKIQGVVVSFIISTDEILEDVKETFSSIPGK